LAAASERQLELRSRTIFLHRELRPGRGNRVATDGLLSSRKEKTRTEQAARIGHESRPDSASRKIVPHIARLQGYDNKVSLRFDSSDPARQQLINLVSRPEPNPRSSPAGMLSWRQDNQATHRRPQRSERQKTGD